VTVLPLLPPSTRFVSQSLATGIPRPRAVSFVHVCQYVADRYTDPPPVARSRRARNSGRALPPPILRLPSTASRDPPACFLRSLPGGRLRVRLTRDRGDTTPTPLLMMSRATRIDDDRRADEFRARCVSRCDEQGRRRGIAPHRDAPSITTRSRDFLFKRVKRPDAGASRLPRSAACCYRHREFRDGMTRFRGRDNARRELRAVKWFVMHSRMLLFASCPSFRGSPHDFPGEGRAERGSSLGA